MFPHDWQASGIFELNIAELVLAIRERRIGKSVVVAGVAVQQSDLARITIESNYSELRAKLIFTNNRPPPPINVAHEFAKSDILLVDGATAKEERGARGRSTFGTSTVALSCKREASSAAPFETPPTKRRATSDAGDGMAMAAKLETSPCMSAATPEQPAPASLVDEMAPPASSAPPDNVKEEQAAQEAHSGEGEDCRHFFCLLCPSRSADGEGRASVAEEVEVC